MDVRKCQRVFGVIGNFSLNPTPKEKKSGEFLLIIMRDFMQYRGIQIPE